MYWRLPSLLAALLAFAFFYLLSLNLFLEPRIAFMASLLYLMDGITFVQARIATLDMIAIGFLIPSIYFFRKKNYLISSFFLGLSLCCKWTAFFILPLYVLFSFERPLLKWTRHLAELLIPSFLIYIILFQAFAFPGPLSLNNLSFFNEIQNIRMAILRNVQMLHYHFEPTRHNYASFWWQWLLLIRPIWYEFDRIWPDKFAGIVCLPNPFLWWPGLLACISLFLKFKDEKARFILLGFLLLGVSWGISPKGGFLYYLLGVPPFLVLGLVYWWPKDTLFLGALVLFVLVGFLTFFPLYAFIPIPQSTFYHLMWLRSWI